MANQEYLAILKQGFETWNQWRKEHIDIVPDLSEANLSFGPVSYDNIVAYLHSTNLSSTNLSSANLSGALQLHFVGETRP